MHPFTKRKIGFTQIRQQIGADLIGKDSYRGVTFTYSWLANQFGHISLGYIPTLIAWAIIKWLTKCEPPAFWVALMVSVLWLLFELYNFLGPLLSGKQSSAQHLFISSKAKYIFKPDWKNVTFDTFTDLLFFWFGAFSASIFLEVANQVIIIVVILVLAFLYPAYYWYLTKMYLQYARYPIQFRLSQWNRQSGEPLPDQDIETVKSYIHEAGTTNGNHLLIFGGRRSGKSTLSIGIGTELSIKQCTASYYTAVKLLNTFSLTDEEIMTADNCKVWSWRSASLLIIDDINPGSPTPKTFLSPQDIADAIDTGKPGVNKACLKNKNVIWVLGDDDAKISGDWRELLADIGVPGNRIKTVDLGPFYK